MGLLFRRDSGTCDMPDNLTEPDQAFIGSLSFYHFNMILSGACTACTCLLIFSLMAEHARRLSNPSEQIKIMRIVNLLPAYSVLSFISICFPNVYAYLEPWTEVFQGIALYSFQMLLIDFLAPNDRQRIYFFSSLNIPKAFKKGQYREGLSWLKLTWYSVLIYPVITTLCAVLQCVAQAAGVLCIDSSSPKFAHVWIQVLSSVSISFAINAVLRFYQNTHKYMEEHKPMMKLLAFKLVVGLVFLEQILFLILDSTKVLKPTKYLSYADVHIGLPTMIICIQLVPFAFFIHYAYSTKPYLVREKPGSTQYARNSQEYLNAPPPENMPSRPEPRSYQGGPGGLYAWAAYLNPLDMFREAKDMYNLLHNIPLRTPKEASDAWPEGSTAYEQQTATPEAQQPLTAGSAEQLHEESLHEAPAHEPTEFVQPGGNYIRPGGNYDYPAYSEHPALAGDALHNPYDSQPYRTPDPYGHPTQYDPPTQYPQQAHHAHPDAGQDNRY